MGYAGQRATAQRLINAKGGDVVFRRAPDSGQKDPVTQEVTSTGAGATFKRRAVGFPPGRTWSQRNDSLITKNMIELWVAPNGYSPLHGDNVTWASRSYSIVDWVELDPDGTGPLLLRILVEA